MEQPPSFNLKFGFTNLTYFESVEADLLAELLETSGELHELGITKDPKG